MKTVQRPSAKQGVPDLCYQGTEKEYKIAVAKVHGGESGLLRGTSIPQLSSSMLQGKEFMPATVGTQTWDQLSEERGAY